MMRSEPGSQPFASDADLFSSAGDSVHLDPSRFPRASQYVRSLPAGLHSFPGCLARRDLLAPLLEKFPSFAQEENLPEVLRDIVTERAGPRVLEARAQTLGLMARDRYFRTDADFLAFAYEGSAGLYRRPIHRTLMRLASPQIVVAGAARRWSTFHQGSLLELASCEQNDTRFDAKVVLTHPHGLFPQLFLELLIQSFRAALDLARGADVRVTLTSVIPGRAEYLASWRATGILGAAPFFGDRTSAD